MGHLSAAGVCEMHTNLQAAHPASLKQSLSVGQAWESSCWSTQYVFMCQLVSTAWSERALLVSSTPALVCACYI